MRQMCIRDRHWAFSAIYPARNDTPVSLLVSRDPSSIKNQNATSIDMDIHVKLQIKEDLNLYTLPLEIYRSNSNNTDTNILNTIQ